MRIHSDRTDKRASAPEVADAGRAILEAYDFRREARGQAVQREDFELCAIVKTSLHGDVGKPIARKLVRDLLAASASHAVSGFEYNDLMAGLLKTHPDDVLDELVAGDKKAQSRSVALMSEFTRHNQSPMDSVPEDVLLAWCDRDPAIRYPFAAAIVRLFGQTNDESPTGWKGFTQLLLSRAPDKKAVFNEMASRLRYSLGGVGSLASQYEARLKLLGQIDVSDFPELVESVEKAKAALQAEVDAWRKRDTDEERRRSGRFE
jgi:hypothetical protein